MFAILAIVTGANSYRRIVTFVDARRDDLSAIFSINWRRTPAHTAVLPSMAKHCAAASTTSGTGPQPRYAARSPPRPPGGGLDGKSG